ncbi:MAG TPA: MoaD/ThiS family protein [Fimbriimonadaceae bacterium]|nr:MoaD/ThiS family protein [Fimbriimonadaceae bacterium]
MIRVVVPYHLRNLAKIGEEISLEVEGTVSVDSILDALEDKYPNLKGTIRDHVTKQRRPFIRFFACGQDFSNGPTSAPLPDAVAKGEQQFLVVGAIAGG